MRIIESAKPDIFIFENVKGLFSSSEGRDFEVILQTVTDIGLYDCEWQLLNTRWFLPQNRERIYFIGHLRGKSEPKVFPIREGNKTYSEDNEQTRWDRMEGTYSLFLRGGARQRYDGETLIFLYGIMGDKNKMWLEDGKDNSRNFPQGQRVYSPEGDACQLTSQGGGWGAKTGLYEIRRTPLKYMNRNQKNIEGDYAFTIDGANTGGIKEKSGIRRLTPLECERLQGFPDGYTEGISDSQRYKTLGNAVSVPVMKAIGERLL